jgi:hypothetical protein
MNTVYDALSTSSVDATKWKLLSFRLDGGQTWTHEEPEARLHSLAGGLALTVDPFTRKHDGTHMFDDPKHFYVSTRTFPVSQTTATIFEVEMGAETHRSNAEDIGDAFAGFITVDFATGMVFDFVATGRKIGAIYERLLIPGITDADTTFTYLVESPFSGIRTEPRRLHHYSVRFTAGERRVEWLVDGKLFFKAENIPVVPTQITLGFGLFTLKPVDSIGSTSLHGQGATGIWRNFSCSP